VRNALKDGSKMRKHTISEKKFMKAGLASGQKETELDGDKFRPEDDRTMRVALRYLRNLG
jgi:hypothetical protein